MLQRGNHLKFNSGVVSFFAFYPLSAFPTIPMSFKLNMSHLSWRLLQKIGLLHNNTNSHIQGWCWKDNSPYKEWSSILQEKNGKANLKSKIRFFPLANFFLVSQLIQPFSSICGRISLWLLTKRKTLKETSCTILLFHWNNRYIKWEKSEQLNLKKCQAEKCYWKEVFLHYL